MSRRALVLLVVIDVWAFVVAAGTLFVARRAARLEQNGWYVAAHAMRKSLAAEDLKEPRLASVAGEFLAHDIAAGQALKPESLRPKPTRPITPGRVAAFVPLLFPAAASTDAGTVVDVFGKSDVIADDVEIDAIWCESTTCWAVIELTFDEAKKMNLDEKPHAVPSTAKKP